MTQAINKQDLPSSRYLLSGVLPHFWSRSDVLRIQTQRFHDNPRTNGRLSQHWSKDEHEND